MCELCDGDRVTVLIADDQPADEPDNVAMIARDLADCVSRLRTIAMSGHACALTMHYCIGNIDAISGILETM